MKNKLLPLNLIKKTDQKRLDGYKTVNENLFCKLEKCEELVASFKREVLNKTIEIAVLNSDQYSSLSENIKKKDTLQKDYESLKIKIRYREVAIEHVKQKFSDCRELISYRDSTIEILRYSLSAMHQTYAGVVI